MARDSIGTIFYKNKDDIYWSLYFASIMMVMHCQLVTISVDLFQDFDYEDEVSCDYNELYDGIDQLALSFSSRSVPHIKYQILHFIIFFHKSPTGLEWGSDQFWVMGSLYAWLSTLRLINFKKKPDAVFNVFHHLNNSTSVIYYSLPSLDEVNRTEHPFFDLRQKKSPLNELVSSFKYKIELDPEQIYPKDIAESDQRLNSADLTGGRGGSCSIILRHTFVVAFLKIVSPSETLPRVSCNLQSADFEHDINEH